MDTLSTIKEILKEKQNIDPANVNLDSTFDDLSIDSLDTLELVCELEDRMGIDFGDPEGLKTVGDVVSYVDKL